jgi:hypothetical protein
LVGVDAEGGVGLSVPEPALDVDDRDVVTRTCRTL